MRRVPAVVALAESPHNVQTRAPVPSALDIGIVGCGYAGSATALFLKRAGHRVTVYEAVDAPGAVGAGIIVQPTGLHVLERLGLAGAVIARGSRLSGLHCRTPSNRRVVELIYDELGAGMFGLGMHRGAMFELLYEAVLAEGVEVRCGVSCESLTPATSGKRSLIDASGATYGPHDLVVVADGARSSLRDDDTLTRRATPYPYGALWYVAEAPAELPDATLMQTCDSTHKLLGLLPSGLGPKRTDGSADRRLVTLFWSVCVDRVQALREAGLDAFRRDAIRVDPRAEPIVAQLRSMDDLLLSTYLDVVMHQWHAPSLVYLGDAGHAMSPQLGQGCNLALMDAMVLADVLAAESSVDAALARYTRERRANIEFYQFASRWLTPMFQSDLGVFGTLRDLFMGPMCSVPFVRGQMLRSMAGVKRGIVRPSMALPPAPKLLSAPREV